MREGEIGGGGGSNCVVGIFYWFTTGASCWKRAKPLALNWKANEGCRTRKLNMIVKERPEYVKVRGGGVRLFDVVGRRPSGNQTAVSPCRTRRPPISLLEYTRPSASRDRGRKRSTFDRR